MRASYRVEVMLPVREERHLEPSTAVHRITNTQLRSQHKLTKRTHHGGRLKGKGAKKERERTTELPSTYNPPRRAPIITSITIRRRTVTKAPIRADKPRRHSSQAHDCRRRLFAPTAALQPATPPCTPQPAHLHSAMARSSRGGRGRGRGRGRGGGGGGGGSAPTTTTPRQPFSRQHGRSRVDGQGPEGTMGRSFLSSSRG
jgi:hypothetical protein